jgi:hypothetical protein
LGDEEGIMIAPCHLRSNSPVQFWSLGHKRFEFILRVPGSAVLLTVTGLFALTALPSNKACSDTLHSRFFGQAPRVTEEANAGRLSDEEHPIRQLERGEIEDLISRGEEFIVRGDFASARLVLQRAAEADDPKAALLLAGTYDPIVLLKVRIQGFAADVAQGLVPDVALARTWYERARKLGSAEAARRLEALTGQKDTRAAPQE